MKLSNTTLSKIPSTVSVPRYDRNALQPGILHVGVGNFHRAHQAVYLNDLLNAGGDPAWGILGAGVCAPDANMRSTLQQQDFLSTVVETDADGLMASVIGSMIGFLPVQPQNNRSICNAMRNPQTRIVSLTVTEGGYYIDAETGNFDVTHPSVAADILDPNKASTVFGAIVSGLASRKSMGLAPFTIMSCDNIPGNGDITRNAVLGIAKSTDRDLAKWIDENVCFPNSMVDRITPATSDRERQILHEKFDIEDLTPVFCEPFRQWVLEDKFTNGRPDLESVGVTFTNDIHDFEAMKIRILNGGHAILAYASGLMGIEFAHDAMITPTIKSFLIKVLQDDVLPFVKSVPGFSPQQYLELIIHRFSNPGVADTIRRLCLDGSNRQPKFIVPSIFDNLSAQNQPLGLALTSALWCRYCVGKNDFGQTITPNDPQWSRLQRAAIISQSDPIFWIKQKDIYGDLSDNSGFVGAFADALRSLEAIGTAATLRLYLNNGQIGQSSHCEKRFSK